MQRGQWVRMAQMIIRRGMDDLDERNDRTRMSRPVQEDRRRRWFSELKLFRWLLAKCENWQKYSRNVWETRCRKLDAFLTKLFNSTRHWICCCIEFFIVFHHLWSTKRFLLSPLICSWISLFLGKTEFEELFKVFWKMKILYINTSPGLYV